MTKPTDFYEAVEIAKAYLTEKYYADTEAARRNSEDLTTPEQKNTVGYPSFPTLDEIIAGGLKIYKTYLNN